MVSYVRRKWRMGGHTQRNAVIWLLCHDQCYNLPYIFNKEEAFTLLVGFLQKYAQTFPGHTSMCWRMTNLATIDLCFWEGLEKCSLATLPSLLPPDTQVASLQKKKLMAGQFHWLQKRIDIWLPSQQRQQLGR